MSVCSMLMYYFWIVGQAHRKMAKTLREQLKVVRFDILVSHIYSVLYWLLLFALFLYVKRLCLDVFLKNKANYKYQPAHLQLVGGATQKNTHCNFYLNTCCGILFSTGRTWQTVPGSPCKRSLLYVWCSIKPEFQHTSSLHVF